MRQFVITANPSDFPGKHVVRGVTIGPGRYTMDAKPTAVVNSLEEARQFIPPGMVRFRRDPQDDPVIVEWWI